MRRLTNWKLPALLLVLTSIAGFCLANGQIPLLIGSFGVVLVGWWHSERSGGQSLPRWAVLGLVGSVVLWTVYKTSGNQLDVTLFCEFLTLVLVAKSWDRKRSRDVAQLIAMSVFLIIGAILDSNVLAVGVVVLISMPLTAWAVMALQIGAGMERAADAGLLAEQAAARSRGLNLTIPDAGRGPRLGLGTARRLLPVTAATTAIGFAVALVVFLIVPRGVAARNWGGWGTPSATLRTGFTQDVELGRAGLLTESQRTVLQARFSDGNNRSVGGPEQVFYLRGAVLDRYSKGLWQASTSVAPRELALVEPTRDRTIVQDIDLRQSVSSSKDSPLFAIWRAGTITVETGEKLDQRNGIWYRDPNRRGPLKYRVTSVLQAVPREVPDRLEEVTFPSAVIRDYAAQVLRNAGIEPERDLREPADDTSVARILTGHLHGHFQYTTEIGSPPDGQDPIEWFLTTERKGHCEYFASALTAMCRSVGVNARVIAGYVAMEYDESTDTYTVRESNAHAWTEIEAAPGVWLTFDPTPPIALITTHEADPRWTTRLARLMDGLNDIWTNSVVMFDNQQQDQVFDFGRLRFTWVEALSRQAGDEFRASRGRSMLKYTIATAAVLVLAVGLSVIAFRAATDVGRFIRRSAGLIPRRGAGATGIRAMNGFYGDALESLGNAGHRKPPSMPPLAFARHVRDLDSDLGGVFEEIVSLYYRVRFGGDEFTSESAARATELNARLRALAAAPRRPAS